MNFSLQRFFIILTTSEKSKRYMLNNFQSVSQIFLNWGKFITVLPIRLLSVKISSVNVYTV